MLNLTLPIYGEYQYREDNPCKVQYCMDVSAIWDKAYHTYHGASNNMIRHEWIKRYHTKHVRQIIQTHMLHRLLTGIGAIHTYG